MGKQGKNKSKATKGQTADGMKMEKEENPSW